LISVAVSCGQTEEEVEEVPPQLVEIHQIADSLIEAYDQNSVQKLNSFLEFWSTINCPYLPEKISNDTVRNVYDIYLSLYNPFDLTELTRDQIKFNMYSELSFIIIQNKVYYDFNYNGIEIPGRDSIVDFRPPVHFQDIKILYLTYEFKEALKIYLGNFPNLTNSNNADILNQSSFEVEEKIEFLSQLLGIVSSLNGDYWHIETQPEITSIHFNAELNKARVNFRFGYIVGEVLMVKEAGNWILNDSSIAYY
jgi:hypothetical protein